MGNEASGGLVVEVAASPVEVGAVLDGSSPALWLMVGLGLACVLWGRKFARLFR